MTFGPKITRCNGCDSACNSFVAHVSFRIRSRAKSISRPDPKKLTERLVISRDTHSRFSRVMRRDVSARVFRFANRKTNIARSHSPRNALFSSRRRFNIPLFPFLILCFQSSRRRVPSFGLLSSPHERSQCRVLPLASRAWKKEGRGG